MRREQKKKAATAAKGNGDLAPSLDDRQRQKLQRELSRKLEEVTAAVEKAESRIHDINEMFCDPTFFDRTSRDHVKKLENEQKTLSGQVEGLMGEWEKLEEQIAELGA